jgi:hypothetical protein
MSLFSHCGDFDLGGSLFLPWMETSAALRLQEDANLVNLALSAAWHNDWVCRRVAARRHQVLPSYDSSVATVLPGTATVESDFSALKWELDDFRSTLTELLLKASCNANSKSLRREWRCSTTGRKEA